MRVRTGLTLNRGDYLARSRHPRDPAHVCRAGRRDHGAYSSAPVRYELYVPRQGHYHPTAKALWGAICHDEIPEYSDTSVYGKHTCAELFLRRRNFHCGVGDIP